MVNVIEGQVPQGYVLEDVIRVRVVLGGQPDPMWQNGYNQLAVTEGVPAEAMGYSTKRDDGAGYEHRGVLVITLPIDVDQEEANGTVDKAVALIDMAEERRQQNGCDAARADEVARNWGSWHSRRHMRESRDHARLSGLGRRLVGARAGPDDVHGGRLVVVLGRVPSAGVVIGTRR